jgi:hypothetical protein
MELLVGDSLRALFRSFEHTAFRLEVRERYDVTYEVEPYQRFMAGQQISLEFLQAWLDLIASLKADGKRIERVRVISRPPSDYTRYGLWQAPHNITAGEDIRYVDRALAGSLPAHDFWLFDSSRLYVMHFGPTDELLGAELVTDATSIVRHCYWRDTAWHIAVPFADYIKTDVRAEQHSAGP